MDNLTHSLIGYVAGETFARAVPAREDAVLDGAVRRRLCIAMGIIGGNLPDADLLVSGGTGSRDVLRYLLMHRGHTHTVPGCLALAALLFAGAWVWLRWRGRRPRSADLLPLAAMAVLAVGLHLGMDALNSYGVHPWWPLDSHWIYGDSVFIVEPLYWLATAPLLFVLHGKVARILLALPLLAGIAAHAFVHRGMPAWWVLAAAATVALVLLGRRLTPRRAAVTAAVLMIGVTLTFVGSRQVAARDVAALSAIAFPGLPIEDAVLTPVPTHPGCWDLLLLQPDRDALVIRHGLLAIGGVGDARRCPIVMDAPGTIAWQPVPGPEMPRVHWFGQVTTPLAELRELARDHCDVRNLLQFVRAPFVARWQSLPLVGDARFDREPGPGFTELVVGGREDRDGTAAGAAACRYHAPWIPPRENLLAPAVRP